MLRSIVRQRAIAGTLCGTSLRVTSVAAVPRVLRDTRVSPVHARAMAKRAKGKSKAGGKTKRSKGYGRAGHVVISLRDVDKYFESGDELFRGVQLGAFDGAKIGVVGVNGAGKVRRALCCGRCCNSMFRIQIGLLCLHLVLKSACRRSGAGRRRMTCG